MTHQGDTTTRASAARTAAGAALVTVLLDEQLRLLEDTAERCPLLDGAKGRRGMPWAEPRWRFDARTIETRVRAVLAERGVHSEEVTCTDGSRWWLVVRHLAADADAGPRLLLLFVRDHDRAALLDENRDLRAGLSDVVTGSKRPVLLLDAELTVLAASPAFHRLFNRNATPVVGTALAELAGGVFDEAETRAGLAALAAGERSSVRTTFGFFDVNGGHHRVAVEGRRIGAATAAMIVANIHDETSATTANGDGLALLDQVPEALLVVDREERLRFANTAAAAMFGWPAEKLRGMDLAALLPAAGAETAAGEPRLDVFAEPRPRRLEGERGLAGLRADGREIALEVSLSRFSLDGHDTTLLLARPAAVATRASQERFESFVRTARFACVLVDRTGRISYANARAQALSGRQRGEVEGRDWFDLFVPAQARLRLRERFEQAMARNRMLEPPHFEYPVRTRDGERRVIDWHAVAMRDATAEITCVGLTGLDITEQRRSHQELRGERTRADEANALKSRVLAATGRDLQQPLQTLSFLHGVLARRATDEASREVLTTLGGVVKAMSGTVEVLLEVGRFDALPEDAHLGDVPLAEVLTDVRTRFVDLAEAKGLRLHVVPSSLTVRTDRRLLERLLNDLVGNAVRHTEMGMVLVGARRRADEVRLVVADTRATVPVSQLRMVAEQLQEPDGIAASADPLATPPINVVQPLSRLARHRLEVRLTVGRGAQFAINLPRSVDVPPVLPLREAAPWRAGDVHALVVADERGVRDSVEQLFVLEGFEVRLARSVGEALALLADEGPTPDLIVADQAATGTAAALRVVRGLQARCGKPVPAVVLISEPLAITPATLEVEGIRTLRKPVTAEALLRLTGELLSLPDATASTPRAARTAPAADGGIALVSAETTQAEAYARVLEAAGHPVVAAPGLEALDDAGGQAPGCLILDLAATPQRLMLEVMEQASRRFDAPMLVLSDRPDAALAVAAMHAGAFEFLAKPVRDDVLRDAVVLALRETRRRRRGDDDAVVAHNRLRDLTQREREVLRLLVAGYSNKAVANDLRISPRTAENHRARIMDKTGARSLAELVRLATSVDHGD